MKSKNMKIVTKSKLYNRLNKNDRSFEVYTMPSTQAGVRVESSGNKKSRYVEIILPSLSFDGEDRTVRVTMSGRQARALFETLNRHYIRENS